MRRAMSVWLPNWPITRLKRAGVNCDHGLATMALLDKAAWWLPRWLDRAMPNLDVEGEHLIEELDAARAHADDDGGRERELTMV